MDEEKTGHYAEVPNEGELTLTEFLHKYWPDLPNEAIERGVALHERLALDRTIYGTSFATVHGEAPHVRRVALPTLLELEAAGSREVFCTKPRRLRPYGVPSEAQRRAIERMRDLTTLTWGHHSTLRQRVSQPFQAYGRPVDPEVNEALVMTTMRRLT